MVWFTVFLLPPFLRLWVCLLNDTPLKVGGFGIPCISGGPAWFRIQSSVQVSDCQWEAASKGQSIGFLGFTIAIGHVLF